MTRVVNHSGGIVYVHGHGQWDADEERDVNEDVAKSLTANASFSVVKPPEKRVKADDDDDDKKRGKDDDDKPSEKRAKADDDDDKKKSEKKS